MARQARVIIFREHEIAKRFKSFEATHLHVVDMKDTSVTAKVSIVMLTWNGLEYTRTCLSSLFDHTAEDSYELIVVDNGSRDGTVEYLNSVAEMRGNVKIIRNASNLGFVRGNNIGFAARTARSDVVVLNNDIIIEQNSWLDDLKAAAYSDEKVGIVGCRLVDEKKRLFHAGTFMPIDTFWGQQIGGLEWDIGQYGSVREVEGVVFACVYIRNALLETIGYLDNDYFSYFEDTDYCLKAKQAGFKVLCTGLTSSMSLQRLTM